jgi:hypothetical protein
VTNPVFSSDYVLSFSGQVLAHVNGQNIFNLSLKAEVVRLSLVLSERELSISFSLSNMGQCAVERVDITNPANQVASFEWNVKGENHPATGVYVGY